MEREKKENDRHRSIIAQVNVTVMWSKGSEVSILNFILICKYFVFPCILYLAQVKLIFYEFGT